MPVRVTDRSTRRASEAQPAAGAARSSGVIEQAKSPSDAFGPAPTSGRLLGVAATGVAITPDVDSALRAQDSSPSPGSELLLGIKHRYLELLSLVTPAKRAPVGAVDLADPKMQASDTNANGTAKHRLERFSGPLFVAEPTPGDVRQGFLGNCHVASAMGAIANARPQAIKDMVKQNDDGTYSVRFYENGNKSRPVAVKVDGDLYVGLLGAPVYGKSSGSPSTREGMELWYPIVEKAYAQWKGGYGVIGDGGNASHVMAEVLGRAGAYELITPGNESALAERIAREEARAVPMVANTFGGAQAARYTNTGVRAGHAYTVLGLEEKGGEKFVKLRNPWGFTEYGNDGKDDGTFLIPLPKFTELFAALHRTL